MRKGWIAALLALALLLSGCAAAAEETGENPLESEFFVLCLSTGKSDCAIIYMDGLVILSDTADADDFETIAAQLNALGIERIDYMILSHYDKDHIGSAAALLRSFQVGTVLRPAYEEDSSEYALLLYALASTDTEDLVLTEDYVIETTHGLVTVDPPDEDYGDDNNNSMITVVSYRDWRLAFLGDARKKRMEEFLDAGAGEFAFIKLPHHGDSNKALLRFLEMSGAAWAVEMLSEEESVEDDLLQTLERLGIELYCTVDGDVTIWWDGETLCVSQT